jgi:hypothetical protein
MIELLTLAPRVPSQLLVVLIGLAVVALAILLLRMGRKIAIFLLVVGGLVVSVAVTLTMLAQADASRQAAIAAQRSAEAATVSAAGQTLGNIIVAVLALVILGIVGAGGVGGVYLYIRWQLAERRFHQLVDDGSHWSLPRRRLSHRSRRVPAIYVVEAEESDVDEETNALDILDRLDLSAWGW